MKNTKTGAYTYNDKPYDFNFGTDLTAYDKTAFVRTVVETLVDDTNYDFVLREIIFDYTIISKFTDIDTSLIKTDINLIEQFLEETNVVEIVKINMKIGLLEELNNAVDKAIEYRTGIHPSPLNDALASLVSTLEKKINEIDLDSAMSMAQKFASMTGKLTPESVVNAYINSDVHKDNLAEIGKVKKQNTKKSNK